jgi:hypothetical protein
MLLTTGKLNMNLLFEYGSPNYGFISTYNRIYEQFETKYPGVRKTKFNKGWGHCSSPGGRCGTSNMDIINLDNNKTVILSFWDRGMESLTAKEWHCWEGLDMVYVIGGLGIDPDEIKEPRYSRLGFSPFLYPLEHLRVYEAVERFRKPYVYEEKIKKACFIGQIYQARQVITDILKKHPLFDIYDGSAGYHGDAYFQKLNEYAITLSLNGNGELCMRDFESMGMGIPVLRSQVVTPLLAPLVADVDYIRGSDRPNGAWFIYGGREPQIAEQFIERIETAINEPEMLTAMSERNTKYFDEYVYPHKIADKFFEVFNLDMLR